MPIGKKIAFLGSGAMAEALVKGLLNAGTASPAEVVCAEPRPGRREELEKRYGVSVTASNVEAVSQAGIVVLSVKPQVVDAVLGEIASSLGSSRLLISIAAGVPIAAIARHLGPGVRIIRTMPNTPALVDSGATALARGPGATDADLAEATRLFQAVGTAVEVDEHLLDAVTGLSGSGPAYMFIAIEALADGGVKMGLPRAVALALAAQTVVGAGKLVLETGDHPGKLKDQVTSAGGTAIAGIHALEMAGFRAALIAAVEAAARRSKELGEGAK
jgi:pyrroline-5-carboxylate reductase